MKRTLIYLCNTSANADEKYEHMHTVLQEPKNRLYALLDDDRLYSFIFKYQSHDLTAADVFENNNHNWPIPEHEDGWYPLRVDIEPPRRMTSIDTQLSIVLSLTPCSLLESNVMTMPEDTEGLHVGEGVAEIFERIEVRLAERGEAELERPMAGDTWDPGSL